MRAQELAQHYERVVELVRGYPDGATAATLHGELPGQKLNNVYKHLAILASRGELVAIRVGHSNVYLHPTNADAKTVERVRQLYNFKPATEQHPKLPRTVKDKTPLAKLNTNTCHACRGGQCHACSALSETSVVVAGGSVTGAVCSHECVPLKLQESDLKGAEALAPVAG